MALRSNDFYLQDWLVQPDQLRLVRSDGLVVSTEPRIMQVLLCLAAHPHQVVLRDTLMQEVWADCIVVDDTLTRCISQLRKIFDDTPDHPKWFETIRSKGYRLLVSPSATPQVTVRASPLIFLNNYKTPLAGLALSLMIFGMGWYAGFRNFDAPNNAIQLGELDYTFIEEDSTLQKIASQDGSFVFYFAEDDSAQTWVQDPDELK